MKTKYIAAALGIAFLFLGACEEEASPPPPSPPLPLAQPQPLPLTVEGDAAIKAAIEELLRANPEIYYTPPGSVSPPEGSTGAAYSIRIVQPDPSVDYSILRVEPDANRHYSMKLIDPKTQRPPTQLDPNELQAIIDEITKRRQESVEK